jgi:hypothetical protein
MNKTPYHITPDELLFLLGLLNLEPRKNTVLADWLRSINYDLLTARDNREPARTLMEKGRVWYAEGAWHMDDELARGLELINRASTRAAFHLQEGGTVTGFTYAQFQTECCRYHPMQDHFTLYPPEPTRGIEGTLLPDDYQPAGELKFREEMDLPTLFVLIEACWQSTLGGLDSRSDQSFTMDDLILGLETSLAEDASRPWLGMELEVDLDKLPLHTIVQDLLDRDLLENLPEGRLRLTESARSLDLILGDPSLLGLSSSFQNPHTGGVHSASWLFGAGELLQIEAVGEGRHRVSTLFAVEIAREWIREAWKAYADVEAPPKVEAAEPQPPASRTLSPAPREKAGLPGWARLLRGLAGAVLSALVIGLLSTTVIGLIQGELEVNQITDRLTAGVSSLAGQVGEIDLPLGEAEATPAGEPAADQGQAAAGADEPQSGSEEPAAPAGGEAGQQTALPQIRVKESNLAQNGFEQWWALGILKNGSDQAFSKIEVDIQLVDPSGEVVYSKTAATRTMLAPGGQTCFDTHLEGWEGAEDDLELRVTPVSAEILEDYQEADLQLGNVQLQQDRTGRKVVLLGEMINPTEQAVSVEMGALLRDGEGQLAAGRYTLTLQNILFPGERFPLRYVFYPREPMDDLSLAENLKFFVVGSALESPPTLPAFELSPEPQAYWDTAGSYHLLGRVVNRSDAPRETKLIASVYDPQGRVIDACTFSATPPVLLPGEGTYYDLHCWQVVPRVDEDPAFRDRTASYEVKVDRGWALRDRVRTVTELEVEDYQIEDIGGGLLQWTGSVAGPVPEDITFIEVDARVIDQDTGRIAAVKYAPVDLETLTFENLFILPEAYPELTPNLEVEVKAYGYSPGGG